MSKGVLLISGPTASGKSALGLWLAKELGGEIVNIDSVQLYRELDIGSAKPDPVERALVPHHLLDIRGPDEPCNVGQFVVEAGRVLTQIQARERLPVLVGGSGLWITCLFHGLASLPQGSASVRARLEKLTNEELLKALREKDPFSAERIHANDRLRLIRALETFELCGVPASVLLKRHAYSNRPYCGLFLILVWPRRQLYERIAVRSQRLVEHGLVRETQALYSKYGGQIQAFKCLGYAQALSVLRAEFPSELLVEEISKATRRFARRQMTFWRNEPPKRGWLCIPGQETIPAAQTPGGKKKQPRVLKEFKTINIKRAQLLRAVRERLARPFTCNEVWYLEAGCLEL